MRELPCVPGRPFSVGVGGAEHVATTGGLGELLPALVALLTTPSALLASRAQFQVDLTTTRHRRLAKRGNKKVVHHCGMKTLHSPPGRQL